MAGSTLIKAVQFEGVWPICALLVSDGSSNAILIICSVEVGAGPKFWVPANIETCSAL